MHPDIRLRDAVVAELGWEPSLRGGHMTVAVEDGAVTLTGHVATFMEKRAAEAAARRVRGVTELHDRLAVRLAEGQMCEDADLITAVTHRLAWDVLVPAGCVFANVRGGWISLFGSVAWHYQKVAAEAAVGSLRGVRGVINAITIAPPVDARDARAPALDADQVGDAIMHALRRSWCYDSVAITVTVAGGRIQLGGTARSFTERLVAAETAWASPGVTEVENHIIVV